jgi:AP endonuclease-1
VKSEARYLQEETANAENSTLPTTEELTEVKSEASVKVNEEEIKEQTSATKATRKRRSTKKEEAEIMPLRVRTQGLRMFVGAHVSAAGGVFNAVNNSKHVGGNAFALFLKSQRKWDNPPLQDEHRDNFVKLCKEHDYDAAKYVRMSCLKGDTWPDSVR